MIVFDTGIRYTFEKGILYADGKIFIVGDISDGQVISTGQVQPDQGDTSE